MNNNQDLNNNQPNNVNNIPVISPSKTEPQANQTLIVENNKNINSPFNNDIPTQTSTQNNNQQRFINNVNNQQINSQVLPTNNNDNSNQNNPQIQYYNETSINDLNVEGGYNHMEKAPDYINSEEVKENIQPTKKTVPITKELKTVLVITGIILAFIFIMPIIFDLLNKIRFH